MFAQIKNMALVGILLSGSGFICVPAQAANIITQLTNDPLQGSTSPSLSADGSKVAFVSQADLAGGNPDNSLEVFVINTDGTGLIQLTSGPVGSSLNPSLSGNATKVAFYSYADLTGGNPDGSGEIFVINTDGTGLVQLTNDPLLGSTSPSLSGNATKVAFHSYADLTGGNPDNSLEVFVINTDGTGLIQLTSGPVNSLSGSPSLSANGNIVAFDSNVDLTGGNSRRVFEVFVINTDGTGTVQLTQGPVQGSSSPSLSANGSKVAFISRANDPDVSSEINVMNTDGTGLLQLTSDPVENSWKPSLSADGSKVAFVSQADLTGENPDGSGEIFLMNTDGTGLLQLTSDPSWGSLIPSLSPDGSMVAFHSLADHTGGNPDHSVEIFVMNMGASLPPPLPSSATGGCGGLITTGGPKGIWGIAVLCLMFLAVRVARRRA